MLKEHFKSNGNGSITLSKAAISFWTLMILLLGMIVPVVFAYGQLNENVDNLQNEWNEISEKVSNVDKYISASEVKIENIQEDISEIKNDIKEIKQELKGGK